MYLALDILTFISSDLPLYYSIFGIPFELSMASVDLIVGFDRVVILRTAPHPPALE